MSIVTMSISLVLVTKAHDLPSKPSALSWVLV